MRTRSIVLLTLVGVLVVSAAPQKSPPKPKPDFSGTWLLDQKKSDSGVTRSDLPIKIVHSDPEFRVTRSSESNGQIVERSSVYFTDGRGEINPSTFGLTTNPSANAKGTKNLVDESKTKWSGNKIVTRTLIRLNFDGGSHFVKFELIHEWKLSDDGKVLTITHSERILDSGGAIVPTLAGDKKSVYNRV